MSNPAVRSFPKWDVAAGGLMIAIGIVFIYFGSGLRMGTLARMGPGYVPIAASCLLIVLGALIALPAFRKPGEEVEWPALRPFVVVVVCPIVFGLLIERIGMVLTVLIVASIARFATRQRFGLEAIVMPVVLTAFCVALFTYALSLPLKLWP
ncbi:tripartite tricarboxylate transporter TctB family protein [Corticibacterium sp. UT-5YL-CI-8]|nr:tripartite tricarboxylate transporter TctB family protein [Tianweitania sp. UT-5YL-CI-8]